MEYLSYADVRDRFNDLLLSEREEGDRVSLVLNMPDEPATRVVFGVPSENDQPGDDVRTEERPKDALVPCIDGVLHRLHINEVGLVPVEQWRAVLDIAAFELATDEQWIDFEAEASMHMNSRDVLMFRPDQFSVMLRIVSSIMEQGDGPGLDLMLIALDTPFLMEVRQAGGLTVWCANESMADEVVQVTGAHNA